MTSIGAYDAKTHFSELLRRVQGGERIGVTWRGKIVAHIIPANAEHRLTKRQAMQELKNMERIPLRGLKIRDLIAKGRSSHHQTT